MANKVLFRVHSLTDPYFGRSVSHEVEEFFKVYKYYAEKCSWTPFDYNDWYGSTYKVKCRVSRVVLTQHNCYVEVECTESIPDHYMPLPSDCIGEKYHGSYCRDGLFASEEVIKSWEA